MATKKYLSLERLTEYDGLIKSTIDTKIANANTSITNHTNDSTIHVTSDNKSQWNTAYTHSTSTHAPTNAEKNIIVGIQKNGTDLTVDSNTRKVNITVPTTAAEIGAAPSSHNHNDTYDVKGAASSALTSANEYTDQEIAKLLNNSTEAVDSIYELRDAMEENADAIEALNSIAAGKANATHSHSISEVTNLQSALDAKATQTNLDSHTSNTTVHITSTERTNWNAAKTHADSAHAPINAEKNQNAFSNVKVGSTTVAADTATDTLEIAAGTGISLTADTTNDKVTITNSGVLAVATGSANGTISVNTNGTSANVAVKGLGSAAYTNSSAYATAEHTHTVDTALSTTSTNPVQNKVINSAISTLTSTVTTNIESISSHTAAISNLQTAVAEIKEITSAEISALFAN